MTFRYGVAAELLLRRRRRWKPFILAPSSFYCGCWGCLGWDALVGMREALALILYTMYMSLSRAAALPHRAARMLAHRRCVRARFARCAIYDGANSQLANGGPKWRCAPAGGMRGGLDCTNPWVLMLAPVWLTKRNRRLCKPLPPSGSFVLVESRMELGLNLWLRPQPLRQHPRFCWHMPWWLRCKLVLRTTRPSRLAEHVFSCASNARQAGPPRTPPIDLTPQTHPSSTGCFAPCAAGRASTPPRCPSRVSCPASMRPRCVPTPWAPCGASSTAMTSLLQAWSRTCSGRPAHAVKVRGNLDLRLATPRRSTFSTGESSGQRRELRCDRRCGGGNVKKEVGLTEDSKWVSAPGKNGQTEVRRAIGAGEAKRIGQRRSERIPRMGILGLLVRGQWVSYEYEFDIRRQHTPF